jgi:hypothetical protein
LEQKTPLRLVCGVVFEKRYVLDAELPVGINDDRVPDAPDRREEYVTSINTRSFTDLPVVLF